MNKELPINFETIPILRGFETIKPVYDFAKNYNVILTGGYVRWMCSTAKEPSEGRDIDLYFKDEKSYTDALIELEFGFKLGKKFENEMCVEFKQPESGVFKNCPPIQLIKPILNERIHTFGNGEEIISHFDFSCVRLFIKDHLTATCDTEFIKDEQNKRLRIKHIVCPISAVYRIGKYLKKGYTIKLIEIVKLFIDWDDRDLDYRNTLIQLVEKSSSYDHDDPDSGLSEDDLALLYRLMKVD